MEYKFEITREAVWKKTFTGDSFEEAQKKANGYAAKQEFFSEKPSELNVCVKHIVLGEEE